MMWEWLQSLSLICVSVPVKKRFRSSPIRRKRATVKCGFEHLEQRLVLTVSSEEQLFVYLLNKARHDPQAYAADENLGNILDAVEARQPLAVNDSLFASAQFHALEMANNDYFAHQSAVTGDWPNKMARDAGYDLPDFYPNNNNFIESLAAGNLYGDPADVIRLLIVDAGVPSLGHRNHLLGIDSFNAEAREIGVGHGFNLSSLYDHYWAAHITRPDTDGTYLTGVVYQDANADQAFSLNEGLAGVTVGLAGIGMTTETNAAGGWSIRVPSAGSYTILVSGGGFAGLASQVVQVGAENREVDFTSGIAGGVVDFGVPAPGNNMPPVNTLPAGPLNPAEDTAFAITGLSVADPDAGTNSVTVTLGVSHGNLTIKTNVVNGVTSQQVTGNNSSQVVLTGPIAAINATLADALGLSYLATANFNGSDTLSVLSNDIGHTGSGGAQTDFDTVDLMVSAVNDAPVNTVPAGPLSVVTETSLNVTGLSLSDVDLGTQDALVTLSVLHGTLTLRTDVAGGLTVADLVNNGSNSVTITAPRTRLVATLASSTGVAYVSENGYVGPDTLTMDSSDQGNTGSGPVGTDQDAVALTVQPTPIAPIVTLPGTSVASVKRKPVIVGTGATITDADSPTFQSGRLTIQITGGAQATDKLTLNRVGGQTGQLNLQRDNVRLGRTVIGRISGGTNGAPLVIQFTSNVSLATVQTVLRNVTLKASRGRLTVGTRMISFMATDPTLAASVPQLREVNVA